MDKTAAIVCNAFLNKCAPEQHAALLQFLPFSEAEHLQSLPRTLGNPSKQFELPEEMLDQIHFSWITPILRALPETEIRLFLSSLNQAQIKGLKQQLLFANHLPQLPSLIQNYLRHTLFEGLSIPDLLPPSCLPDQPLNTLLEFPYARLLVLIDLLSMHDLACEIRHIIDTVKLKRIYSLLTPSNQAYLKSLSHKKEPVAFKKIGLNHWNKDTEALRSILLQRGVNRLAKALYSHDPSLLWHLTHRLDIERGQMLHKLCSPLNHPRAHNLLTEQILNLAETVKTINPS